MWWWVMGSEEDIGYLISEKKKLSELTFSFHFTVNPNQLIIQWPDCWACAHRVLVILSLSWRIREGWDKIPQCVDGRGSDEGSFCSSTNCSHLCINSPSGPTCYCQPGYQVAADRSSCLDIDECQLFGSCSQICQNTVGSFSCSCMLAYTKQNSSCVTTMREPLLFFSTEVRGLRVNSMEYFSIATNLPYVIGIGFWQC